MKSHNFLLIVIGLILIATLFFIAAIALLPSWLVGGCALGAGVALLIQQRREAARRRKAIEEHLARINAALAEGANRGPAPSNVINFREPR